MTLLLKCSIPVLEGHHPACLNQHSWVTPGSGSRWSWDTWKNLVIKHWDWTPHRVVMIWSQSNNSPETSVYESPYRQHKVQFGITATRLFLFTTFMVLRKLVAYIKKWSTGEQKTRRRWRRQRSNKGHMRTSMTGWTQSRRICTGEAVKQRWKVVQEIGVMKDRDGNVLAGSTSVIKRLKMWLLWSRK